MAKKVGGKAGSLGFEYHQLSSEQRQKISIVSEQYPEMCREHIAIVLQYYQFDCDKSITGITSDGGADALKDWNQKCNQNKANNKSKKKNKKKNKKDDGTTSGGSSTTVLCNDADDSSSLHSSNIDFDGERESNVKADDCDETSSKVEQDISYVCSSLVSNPTCDELSLSDTLVENEGSGSPLRMATDLEDGAEDLTSKTLSEPLKCVTADVELPEKSADSPREGSGDQSRSSSQNQFSRQRHGSAHHSKSSSFSEDQSNLNAQKRGGTKCKKDLLRQTSSLQRIQTQLEQRLEDSFKNMKNAFTEIRKVLDERQQKLEQDMEKVKEEARALLKSRQDLSADLKRRCDRNQSLSESEWNNLRADIKQFVTERKFDDDLGKTIWFQWSNDTIIEEIQKFGEVCPVKNAYSQRQVSEVNSPEPSASVAADSEDALAILNADFQNSFGGGGDNDVDEDKPEKEVQIKNIAQSESKPRVFLNKTYSQNSYGGRFRQNHNNRGPGFYHNNRGRGHMGGGYPRSRNYDNYRQFGGERNADYRAFPPHHSRGEFTLLNEDKSVDVPISATENSSYRYPGSRDNQGHFREKRPHGNYWNRPFNNYNRGRAPNRAPRLNAEAVAAESESATDKNANTYHEVPQENKEMFNGY